MTSSPCGRASDQNEVNSRDYDRPASDIAEHPIAEPQIWRQRIIFDHECRHVGGHALKSDHFCWHLPQAMFRATFIQNWMPFGITCQVHVKLADGKHVRGVRADCKSVDCHPKGISDLNQTSGRWHSLTHEPLRNRLRRDPDARGKVASRHAPCVEQGTKVPGENGIAVLHNRRHSAHAHGLFCPLRQNNTALSNLLISSC